VSLLFNAQYDESESAFKTRYNEFRRMTRQWRHLQMLKRAGRGHAAEGITGTKAGECALLCPACPQPGKNLPRDGSWRHVPQERRFLYALFLALDANFRMKRKDVSSEADDPSLGDGIAFFSQVEEYMAHLDKHWDIEQEVHYYLRDRSILLISFFRKVLVSRMMRSMSLTGRPMGLRHQESAQWIVRATI
jgi:hypothetical protein